MIACLRTRLRKQPIIALYFESEPVLKFYNLDACRLFTVCSLPHHVDSTDSGQTGASLLHVRMPLLTGRVIIEQVPHNRCVNRRLRSAFTSGSLIGAQWVAKGTRKTKTMSRRAEPESFVRGVQL